jgi:hypothetical protein
VPSLSVSIVHGRPFNTTVTILYNTIQYIELPSSYN